MKTLTKALGATFASTLALNLAAYAQQDGAGQQQQPQPQMQQQQDAEAQRQQTAQSQCLQNVNGLAQRMNEDGYWLAGYSGYGVNNPGGTPPASGRAVGTPPAATAPRAAPAGDPAGADGRASPWANVTWAERPHYEIRTLIRAAHVLADNGDEQGCMTVASAAEQRYDGYVSQLKELGVEPQEITDWRQAEITAAVPVSETNFPRRVDDVIGADVRNAQDEDLGDIDDVVLDPRSGGVQYVIVSRGGFFGIGSKEIAVPWEHLRVAPGTNTFVLPVNEAAMQQAPEVAQENLIDPGQTGSVQQNEVESYWRDALNQ